ncbi:MAG TPA: GMC family oxidoreductase N-terminal domain-containing protein [Stellaceae bacterium]|jgi:choline dehydrogenase|nr:GMC family oxidoreductase N-terminal domain-containing protein [Stellaceae bacterium]
MAADYIVIGAGSAGCVVASRLSEDGSRVTLLEAGPPDRDIWIHIPAGVLRVLNNTKINWNFLSEGEPGTGGRQLQWPRGKTLGGTSSINGMLYVRGNPADYDSWAQMGCRGWSYEEVLPFFKKSETYRGNGDPEYRSQGGPLIVEDYRTILDLTHRFVEAAQQAGFQFTPDYNGKQQEGVAYSQMTRRGKWRGSTAQTFLREARGRGNLKVETDALVTKLLFDGRRCTGVAFRQGGVDRQETAAQEVILCGGAVNSPHVLQISGIGPAAHLQSIGVPVLHDLPGVGANLNDHYVVRISHRVRGAETINQLARGARLMREALKFATVGNGALTFGVTSAMVFCHSREGLAAPDLQLLFTPASYAQGVFRQLERQPGMTVAVCPVRPESRGTIMAQSPDPTVYPAIRPNYLSAPSDLRVLIAGIHHTRRIFAQPAIGPYTVEETVPGPDVQSDEQFAEFARSNGTNVFHPVGTCKMGTDPMAVVDPRLRVHGIAGLRVIDASVMPAVTTGNTNAPTIMVGEKGSEMIKEDAREQPAAAAAA